jgi:hypothetical protein
MGVDNQVELINQITKIQVRFIFTTKVNSMSASHFAKWQFLGITLSVLLHVFPPNLDQ